MNTPLLPAHDTEAKPQRAVLLGVGNILLSDEGVGVRLVERILDRHRLPAGVAVLDGGTCAMEMLEDLEHLDLLVIENVGNLVCPTGYDLGEDTRVALLSVTEGEDNPLKYPQLVNSADVVVVTKTDIADAVEWNREEGLAAIRQIAPDAVILETSARTGVGVQALLDLLLDSGDAQNEPTIQLQEAT